MILKIRVWCLVQKYRNASVVAPKTINLPGLDVAESPPTQNLTGILNANVIQEFVYNQVCHFQLVLHLSGSIHRIIKLVTLRIRFLLILAIGLLLVADLRAQVDPAAEKPTLADEDFFESQVRPILLAHCIECHGPENSESELRLDSRAAMLAGNDAGPVIAPTAPAASRLLALLPADAVPHMPPEGQLSEDSIEILRQWIERGAIWPQRTASFDKSILAAQHWSFQPVAGDRTPIPLDSLVELTMDSADVRALDMHVEASRKRVGIGTVPSASPRELLRRLSFDLLGIPPTWDEWQTFESQPFEQAWPRLVDQYLARPEFGERWSRHWLDVTRYADTKGYVFEDDRNYKTAYLYRDWVIRALNDDLPYDQFLTRQIAADLDPKVSDRSEWAALGFWTLGRRFLNNPYDIYDDRLDVLTRGTLGLTVACARCHDHKYDPISAEDYYSLMGILSASTESKVALTDPTTEYQAELAKRQQELAEYERGEAKQGRINELRRKISEWENSDEAPLQLLVLQDASPLPDLPHVFLRGNPDRLGNQVPRRYLRFLSPADAVPFSQGSGRWELAQSIVDPDNPLTARVWVNRVWMHLFGQGLVNTPSDFGLRSESPSHPELLDDLAATFIREGWSTKRLIRRIVLSQTYRQSSNVSAEIRQRDPENRWLSRHLRRRLNWEAMRDSLLQVAGVLDPTLFGPSVEITREPFSHRRTLYGFIDRQNLPSVFRTFDLASPDTHSPGRFTTTVPQQALYLMNDPFVLEMARATYKRSASAIDDGAGQGPRVRWLYQQLFLREPGEREIDLAEQFLATATESQANPDSVQTTSSTSMDAAWVQYVQALLISNEFQFVD